MTSKATKTTKPHFYRVELNKTEWEMPDRYQKTEPSRLRCLRSGLVSTDVWLCLVTGCGKVRTCGLVDLQTDQRVNCGPKLADRQCGPVGKLRTTKMRIPRNRTPNERCAELTVAFMCYAPLYAFTAAVQAVV